MRPTAALILLCLAAGCDGGADPAAPARPETVVTVRNEYHDSMLRLDDLQRGGALRRAIRSAGESCDRVTASAFQQDYTNLKMWTVRCQKSAYAVFLAANGDVQVRKCADAAVLKLPLCKESDANAAKPRSD